MISKRQLSMIIAEKLKNQQEESNFSWNKMSKALNSEGPNAKKAVTWKNIS